MQVICTHPQHRPTTNCEPTLGRAPAGAGLTKSTHSGTVPLAGGLASYLAVSSPEAERNGSSAKVGAPRCVACPAKPEKKRN